MNLTDIPDTRTLQLPYVLEAFFEKNSYHYSYAQASLNNQTCVLCPPPPSPLLCVLLCTACLRAGCLAAGTLSVTLNLHDCLHPAGLIPRVWTGCVNYVVSLAVSAVCAYISDQQLLSLPTFAPLHCVAGTVWQGLCPCSSLLTKASA
jgi:hypothetical protein